MVPRNIALVTDQPALSSAPSAAGGAFPAIGQGTPNLEDRPVSSAIASVTLESGELVTETMTMNTHVDDFSVSSSLRLFLEFFNHYQAKYKCTWKHENESVSLHIIRDRAAGTIYLSQAALIDCLLE